MAPIEKNALDAVLYNHMDDPAGFYPETVNRTCQNNLKSYPYWELFLLNVFLFTLINSECRENV